MFNPINTQEEFDAAIKDRLARDREAQAKKYEGFISPDELKKITAAHETEIKKLTDANAASEQTIKSLNDKIAEGDQYRTELEKTRIAIAEGLDVKYASRLRGQNKEEWTKDAKELAKDFKAFAASQNHPAPLGSPNPSASKSTSAQFAEAVSEFFN